MATKKLWTECSSQLVAFMMAAIVVPLGCLSSARTISCLVLGRLKAVPTFPRFAVLFGCVAGRAMVLRMLLCDMMDPLVATAHVPPPTKPHCGVIASGAGSAAHRA